MFPKYRTSVLLVSVILLFGSGLIMANAQSSNNLLLYLPVLLKQGAPGTPVPTSPVPTQAPTTQAPTLSPTPGQSVELVAVEYAWVNEASPSTNNGSFKANGISVGKYNGSRDGLVKFDISTIPTGTQIVSAGLYMNYQLYAGGGTTRPAFTITAHRVSTDWSDQSVTWNSRPTYGEAYFTTTFYQYGSVGFGVTDLVQAWIDGTYPNYGIVLEGSANLSGNYAAIFCIPTGGIWGCRDLTGTPYLKVEY